VCVSLEHRYLHPQLTYLRHVPQKIIAFACAPALELSDGL
jgi:hypothetical protein